MGKRLIIKDADFSANAVYTAVEWVEMDCVKPGLTTNPANAKFGKAYTDTTSTGYKTSARANGTILVGNGKKIIVEIYERTTGTRINVCPYTLYYAQAWINAGAGSVVPDSAFPATSIMFNNPQPAMNRYEWTNDTGGSVNFMFDFTLEGAPTITAANYLMRYAIVDP